MLHKCTTCFSEHLTQRMSWPCLLQLLATAEVLRSRIQDLQSSSWCWAASEEALHSHGSQCCLAYGRFGCLMQQQRQCTYIYRVLWGPLTAGISSQLPAVLILWPLCFDCRTSHCQCHTTQHSAGVQASYMKWVTCETAPTIQSCLTTHELTRPQSPQT